MCSIFEKTSIVKKKKESIGKTIPKSNRLLNYYDFTIPMTVGSAEFVKDVIKKFCKKYVFQCEKGLNSGYLHYQGRVSLISKKRPLTMRKLDYNEDLKGIHWSPTSNDGVATAFSYVMKDESRIEGTKIYKDTDKEVFIPPQYRNMINNLRPFQQHILDTATKFDSRTINCIYDEKGNSGKSVIASVCELFGKGIDLPPCNDADKLIQSCCNICKGKNVRYPSPIFIDLPRAMNKERLNGIYTAIEQIKKGKLYDLRYKYQEWWIASTQIWVFTNIPPDIDLLSNDRWKIWTIDKTTYRLKKYEEECDILF